MISGTAQQGQVLSATSGSWSNSPTSYAYQWQDCASPGCSKIAGATGSSYTLQASDVGDTIDVVVTASNAGGSGSATSAPTQTVTAVTAGSSSGLGLVSAVWFTGFGTQNLSSLPWADISQVDAFAEVPCNNGSSSVRTCSYAWLSGANGDQGMGSPLNLGTFVSTVHGQGKVAVLTIGGSDGSYQHWDAACASSSQSAFASEIVSELQKYGFDGIDLDMEQGNSGSFTVAEWSACVQTIRSALNAVTLSSGPRLGLHPLLTEPITPNCCSGQIGTAYQSEDYVEMMLYNAQCAPSPGSCLTGSATGNAIDDLQTGINDMTKQGVPVSKLILGLSTDGYAHASWSSYGTTGAALSTSGAITSIPVAALAKAIPAGNIVLGTTENPPVHTQVLVTPGAPAGATSIPVSSQTPNYAYPSGANIYNDYTGPPDCANEAAAVGSEGIAGLAVWDGNAQPATSSCMSGFAPYLP